MNATDLTFYWIQCYCGSVKFTVIMLIHRNKSKIMQYLHIYLLEYHLLYWNSLCHISFIFIWIIIMKGPPFENVSKFNFICFLGMDKLVLQTIKFIIPTKILFLQHLATKNEILFSQKKVNPNRKARCFTYQILFLLPKRVNLVVQNNL